MILIGFLLSLRSALDKMRSLTVNFLLFTLIGGTLAQYPGGSPVWGQGVPPPPNRPPYGKPNRPLPFSRPVPNYGKPVPHHHPGMVSDDPIPVNPALESSFESKQELPSKLPLLAPNGVVEIYNRVVDDLIGKLELSFKKREIDPMGVVIRPTPATPVRVPGHLQKRPFRRPGAPLYRANPGPPMTPVRMKHARSTGSQTPDEVPVSGDEKPSFRGVGKISKGPLGEEKVGEGTPGTTPEIPKVETSGVVVSGEPLSPAEGSSPPPPPVEVNVHLVNEKSVESSEEEPNLFRARSDEYFPDEEEVEEAEEKEGTKITKSRTTINNDKNKVKKDEKKDKKKEGEDEDEDEDGKGDEEGKKDVDKLIQRYQNKNVNENSNDSKSKGKNKYSAGGGKKKEESGGSKNKKPEAEKEKPEVEKVVEEDEDDEDNQDELDEGGPNPNSFYPPGSPIQQKPNAELTGLSKIKRASDVTVNVDARSALITARLLVGPLHVNINESIEPLERNVRATIPELEAEIILMERHGVVFLHRFTLDRAYGQDVEISMPKANKSDGKKKKIGIGGMGGQPGGQGQPMDPIQAQQRFQTKMAAHISMEVVKLLRSGNLRMNIMRTAQSSMSKLKLPIKTNKKSKKKIKKTEKEDAE